LASVGIFFYL